MTEFDIRKVAVACIDAQYADAMADGEIMRLQGQLTQTFAESGALTVVVGCGWSEKPVVAKGGERHGIVTDATVNDQRNVFDIPAGAIIMGKTVNDACSNDRFRLTVSSCPDIILYGNDMGVCVLETARSLRALGKNVYIIKDAGKSRYDASIVEDKYRGLGAQLIDSSQIHVADGKIILLPSRPVRGPDLRRLPEAVYD